MCTGPRQKASARQIHTAVQMAAPRVEGTRSLWCKRQVHPQEEQYQASEGQVHPPILREREKKSSHPGPSWTVIGNPTVFLLGPLAVAQSAERSDLEVAQAGLGMERVEVPQGHLSGVHLLAHIL